MKTLFAAALALLSIGTASAQTRWPHGAKTAIVLTYDDALPSQLDHAVPALDQAGFKATFFLSNVREADVARWKAAAAEGHELANHTISHPCTAATMPADPAMAQRAADPDARAAATEARMTDDERFQLLHGMMPLQIPGYPPIPTGLKPTAGYFKGIPRLGIPDIYETDASLGVVNPFQLRKGEVSTALPSGLSLAATFSPAIAFDSGSIAGNEARAKGFNELLAGGTNLARDPRNGRNFEYVGEDPLLAGTMAGASIRGVQSERVVSTVKHFALNDQETLRASIDVRIAEPAARESDLLAFQIAIERGRPGSVMCAYNKVAGDYACGADWLLNRVLKRDWRYPGWVMSDWGAVHGVADFTAGFDQQSGSQLDKTVYFDAPLKAEVAAGRVPAARVSDAVRRILRSFYAVGADAPLAEAPVDFAGHTKRVRDAGTAGVVLLKNDGGALPLLASAKSIAVIGGHADMGVMSGGGSTQVTPAGPLQIVPIGGRGPMAYFARMLLMPSAAEGAADALPPRRGSSLTAAMCPKAPRPSRPGPRWRSCSPTSGRAKRSTAASCCRRGRTR